MTLADPKSSRRSWLALLRSAARRNGLEHTPATPAHYHPKPPPDIADLLVMSTVDQKTPAPSPGSADLLDAMVQEHIERATDLENGQRVEGPPQATQTPATSLEDSATMLQREIEMLLHDAGAEGDPPVPEISAPSASSPLTSEAPVAQRIQTPDPPMNLVKQTTNEMPPAPMSASQLPPETTSAAERVAQTFAEPAAHAPATPAMLEENHSISEPPPANPDISREELDVLLATQAVAMEPPVASSPTPATDSAPFVPPPPALPAESDPASPLVEEQKLNEAEGVLAAELASLMAETDPASAAATQPAPAIKSSAIVDESQNSPPPLAVESVETKPDEAGPLDVVEGEIIGEIAGESDAPDSVPQEAPPLNRKPSALRNVLEGTALIIAQLIDLPFVWINELDKNIIGIAALLLLLGGVVLFTLSRIPGM